jgi:hypothetical protein
MNKSDILEYINKPELLLKCNIDQFKHLVYNYPFFQTAHILYLKALLLQDKEQFEKQLPKSSVYISDRDLLFKFLNLKVEWKGDIELTDEEKAKEKPKEASVLLKDRNIKRKINDTLDGMGENISETLSSQIEFSVVKEKDKLEYPSEIYFIEEERDGNNNIITIDADPEDIKRIKRKKDILHLDEKELVKSKAQEKSKKKNKKQEEPFELIETEKVEKEAKKSSEYFDIAEYKTEKEPIKDDLISKFIKENPRLEAKEVKEEIEDISEPSVQEDSNLLSETLIKVYIKQGLYEKAIESYKKLSLKYPEKNTYFASQIEILEEKINKK